MARKKRTAKRRSYAAARPTDEELIARLKEEAPEALQGTIPEALFDAAVEGLLKESTGEVPHFYCRKCGEYHLKNHPHYRDIEPR